MQYVFGGPNWQINQTNKQTKFGSSLFCVCGLCGCGISFSGVSNISALVNYMFIVSTALTCTGRTQSAESGSLEKTLTAIQITPSGSRTVSRDISSFPIIETVRSPREFSFRQLSRVLQEWRQQYSFVSRVALIQCRVQA